ncbi:hypothetical protein M422DRAFT_29895 [Sphaerobolus stellatus SS14]|uniref:Mediator of RNA polymerase II transcription subunit 21 n=1 Tax=Sphaerobolus stellatus (strain SS14) TaxID=990650 RepID=A0A0C9W0R8_SPHS4|nr:hypothetical protein M422DRAFT_29895 [Sphaerobolus stellatus SS14]
MLEQLTHMDRITQIQHGVEQLLTIMSNSIVYLHTRTSFKQVSDDIPITRQRNPEKYDPPDVFQANQKELVADLMRKAKEIEYLIESLPVPEPEEIQAARLAQLEKEMQVVNEEYHAALDRAKNLHAHISAILQQMLSDGEMPVNS